MLRMANAPRQPESIASLIRLNTGTMWHDWFGEKLQQRGIPFMREVSANPGLPEGWAGTADFLVWDPRYNGFVLVDLKTTKGEGIQYIERDGAKLEHTWQVSAYWQAFVHQGYPMLGRAQVLYWPVNEDYKVEGGVQPVTVDIVPLKSKDVWNTMEYRRIQVNAYLQSLLDGGFDGAPPGFVNPSLAPVMPPEQKLYKSGLTYDVTLRPHWSSMFCPYDDALCNCGALPNGKASLKIGEWIDDDACWRYWPRNDYEHIEPVVSPSGVVQVENGRYVG